MRHILILVRDFRGANALEQRSSAVVSDMVNMKGEQLMEVKNNTEAPQLKFNWKHAFLVAAHLFVLIVTFFSDGFTIEVTARALP